MKLNFRHLPIALWGVAFWAGLLLFTGTVQASVKPVELEYDRGLVTLRPGRFSLPAILDQLARVANIDIYITEKISDASSQLGFDRVPVHDMLCTLLKGYSFAVLYSEAPGHQGQVYLSSDGTAFHPAEDMISLSRNPSPPAEINPDDESKAPPGSTADTQAQEDGAPAMSPLEHKIQTLQKEIESGRADQQYNRWSRIKDPRYLKNPRDELARYQKELEKLNAN